MMNNQERYKYTPIADTLQEFEPTNRAEKSITADRTLYDELKDGYSIQTQRNQTCPGIVTIDMRYSPKGAYTIHNVIKLEANSFLRVVVYHHSSQDVRVREILDVELNSGARLELIHLADTASTLMSNINVRCSRDSSVAVTTIDSNNTLLVRNQNYELHESGAQCNINGLYLTSNDEHADNYIKVNHTVGHCNSSQLVKGVLAGKSEAAFTGHIHVAKDAQRTAAFQENHNILLSDQAKVHTRPWLEIYADDVKCNHGATVGRLDPEAIYYMRQRGIPTMAAQRLQIIGFAENVLGLQEFGELQDIVHQKIIRKLQ